MANLKEQIFKKEIRIPRWLHELHGERTRISSLVSVYLTGLACASLVCWQLTRSGFLLWQVAVAALVFLDVGGGVVANLSTSTNLYYQQHSSLRFPFIFLHVIHPVILMTVFPKTLPYFLYVMLFTLAAAITVNMVKGSELQQNLAAFLVVVGCTLSFFFPMAVPVLYIFAPLFLVKLVLGFAVRRPPLDP